MEQIWLNEFIEFPFMRQRKFPFVRLITWILDFPKRIFRIFEANRRFPTWFAVNEKKHMKLNNANWFAFDFTWFQMKWILQFPLHLIWRKNTWKWNLRFPLHLFWQENSWNWTLRLNVLSLDLIWRKIREIDYWNLISFWFDGKIREIEY